MIAFPVIISVLVVLVIVGVLGYLLDRAA